MVWHGESSARRFDELKKKYLQQNRKTNRFQKPAKPKTNFKTLILKSSFIKRMGWAMGGVGAIYGISYFVGNLTELKLTNFGLDYLMIIAWLSMFQDANHRLGGYTNQNHSQHSRRYNKEIANTLFSGKLQEDFQLMKKRGNPKLISSNINSQWGIGLLRFNTTSIVRKIDHSGNLVNEQKRSFMRIGDINFFGKGKKVVIKQKEATQLYKSMRKSNSESLTSKSERYCELANFMNFMTLDQQEYSKILQFCVRKTQTVLRKIQSYEKQVQKKIESQKLPRFYFLS